MKKVTIRFKVVRKPKVLGMAHGGCCDEKGGCHKKHGS